MIFRSICSCFKIFSDQIMVKKSTNDKLNEILNSTEKEVTEGEELRTFRKAKKKLRRSSLYGGGARTHIPKVAKTV